VAEATLLLWDIGGVVLSNAWDLTARQAAVENFDLNAEEFESHHQQVVADFETGRMNLERYLAETVFDRPRRFTSEEFRRFMEARSTPRASALATAMALRRDGRFLMVALNNESRELNEYRIRTFRLGRVFEVFLSSCYTGRRKPDVDAFRHALALTQRTPEETVFLDDRPENVAAAAELGIGTVLVRDPDRLAEEMKAAGIGFR
jgi:putative hydrolase of the HAD superfamily